MHLPCIPVSSDSVVLGLVAAGRSGFDVWGRLARSGEIRGRWQLVWSWSAGPPGLREVPPAIGITDDRVMLEIDNCAVATLTGCG
jgi:hypothetical protein